MKRYLLIQVVCSQDSSGDLFWKTIHSIGGRALPPHMCLAFLITPDNASAKALLRVRKDSTEQVSLRSHAAEALSNLGATEAVSALQRRSEERRVGKECKSRMMEC